MRGVRYTITIHKRHNTLLEHDEYNDITDISEIIEEFFDQKLNYKIASPPPPPPPFIYVLALVRHLALY